MSNCVPGVFIKDGALGKGHNKRTRKKRHRNKVKNSSLRRKRFRKSYPANTSNFEKLDKVSDRVMSDWYWSNYKKAMEWQDRHQVAHWKATALALMEENRYLIQIINSLRPGLVPDVSVSCSNLDKGDSISRRLSRSSAHIPGESADEGSDKEEEQESEEWEEGDENNKEEFEIEMSEEMMQFFEQSYKHKMDQKKLKEKELLEKTEEEIQQMKLNKIKRASEMSLLYGEGASMIIGMETAVQLSFDKYCDSKSPKYWPNIPFRL